MQRKALLPFPDFHELVLHHVDKRNESDLLRVAVEMKLCNVTSCLRPHLFGEVANEALLTHFFDVQFNPQFTFKSRLHQLGAVDQIQVCDGKGRPSFSVVFFSLEAEPTGDTRCQQLS